MGTRQEYLSLSSLEHTHLDVKLCGLFVDTQHPHLGATPDGFVSCACCGEGLLEIKCPYSHRSSVLLEIDDRKFYLERDGAGMLRLKQGHEYYIQVQTQLSICNKQYCDFFVGLPRAYMLSVYRLTQR